MYKINRTAGFSLIELILVIAIIAVLSVMGLAAYTQKVYNTKIDKCTLQMQLWLQAGMSYFVDNGSWPQSVSDLINNGYVPNCPNTKSCSILNNPWGNPYVAQVDPNNNKLLQVSTDIKVDYNAANAVQTAELIANKLPGATNLDFTNNNVPTSIVTVEMNEPAQASRMGTIIESIQIINSGTVIDKPNCPVNMSPKIYVAIAGLTPMNQQKDEPDPNHPYSMGIIQVESCPSDNFNREMNNADPNSPYMYYVCNQDNYNPDVWQPTLLNFDYSQNGNGRLMAITACVLNSPGKLNTAATTNNSGYLF